MNAASLRTSLSRWPRSATPRTARSPLWRTSRTHWRLPCNRRTRLLSSCATSFKRKNATFPTNLTNWRNGWSRKKMSWLRRRLKTSVSRRCRNNRSCSLSRRHLTCRSNKKRSSLVTKTASRWIARKFSGRTAKKWRALMKRRNSLNSSTTPKGRRTKSWRTG